MASDTDGMSPQRIEAIIRPEAVARTTETSCVGAMQFEVGIDLPNLIGDSVADRVSSRQVFGASDRPRKGSTAFITRRTQRLCLALREALHSSFLSRCAAQIPGHVHHHDLPIAE